MIVMVVVVVVLRRRRNETVRAWGIDTRTTTGLFLHKLPSTDRSVGSIVAFCGLRACICMGKAREEEKRKHQKQAASPGQKERTSKQKKEKNDLCGGKLYQRAFRCLSLCVALPCLALPACLPPLVSVCLSVCLSGLLSFSFCLFPRCRPVPNTQQKRKGTGSSLAPPATPPRLLSWPLRLPIVLLLALHSFALFNPKSRLPRCFGFHVIYSGLLRLSPPPGHRPQGVYSSDWAGLSFSRMLRST
jgi:hypothetical protein